MDLGSNTLENRIKPSSRYNGININNRNNNNKKKQLGGVM